MKRRGCYFPTVSPLNTHHALPSVVRPRGKKCKRHKQVVKRTAMRRGPHVASLTRSSCAWQARFPGRCVQTMAAPCCNKGWPISSRRSYNDLVGNQARESDRQSNYALWNSRDNREGEGFPFFNFKQVTNVIIT